MNADPVFYCTFPTSAGAFSVAVDEAGSVVATTFGPLTHFAETSGRPLVRDDGKTAKARRQIEDYLAGKRREFDLPLLPEGTPFQQRVWMELRKIPFGQTRSYGELARTLGSSARAVGRAVGSNPLCPIVPCHRVIGSDGSLTGFAFGLDLKRRLLALEGPMFAGLEA